MESTTRDTARVSVLFLFFVIPAVLVYLIPIEIAMLFNKDAYYKSFDYDYISSEAKHPVGEIVSGFAIEQVIYPRSKVNGFSLLMATYARSNSADVRVRVFKNSDLIKEEVIKSIRMKDNSFIYFKVPETYFGVDDTLRVVLTSESSSRANAVTAWDGECTKEVYRPKLFYGGQEINACLVGRIFKEKL